MSPFAALHAHVQRREARITMTAGHARQLYYLNPDDFAAAQPRRKDPPGADRPAAGLIAVLELGQRGKGQ